MLAFAEAKERQATIEAELAVLKAERDRLAVVGVDAPQRPKPSGFEAARQVVAVLQGHPGWEAQVGANIAAPLTALLQAVA
eukprot:3414113-Pyramimonas_sp.AAC.1